MEAAQSAAGNVTAAAAATTAANPPRCFRPPAVLPVAQKAVEALLRAQARLDHMCNGAASKQAARDAAAARQAEADEQLQVGGRRWMRAARGMRRST